MSKEQHDKTLPLWLEEGEDKKVPIANVVPIAPIEKTYSFAIPRVLEGKVVIGQRVRAPFGKRGRLMECVIVGFDETSWSTTLKYLHDVVEPESWLNAELLELGLWIAKYYAAPPGRTLKAMIPPAVRKQSGFRRVRRIHTEKTMNEIRADGTGLTVKQRQFLETLHSMAGTHNTASAEDVCHRAGVSSSLLGTLIKKGWVGASIVRVPRPAPDFDEPIEEPTFRLNDQQRAALRRVESVLDDGQFRAMLLYGVSGSGKTEVYIQAMKHALAMGRQVMVLVPEIALTTQLVHRFASRLSNVAVIHSGLTGALRSLTWTAIRSGEKRVIIGTRSAVFAPCPNLGLIVVDEEQEPSYKNQQSPRYHTRDVAVQRARLLGIPIVLGSATPSLESWKNCQTLPHYELLKLEHRVSGLKLPSVSLVDRRAEVHTRYGYPVFSRLLKLKLEETLAESQQAILLLNRRGYAGTLYCPKCRRSVTCPRCKSNMVLHRASSQLMCHHCQLRSQVPQTCADPSCAAVLIMLGIGTERVESELRRVFPGARLARMDSDTMTHTREYERVLSDFAERRVDILLGTQMLAKGLDFPSVSLVGVIDADTGLHQPDFRANERTFQMITQVAGRAGRAKENGQVVIQTVMGDLPVFQAALHHDYVRFASAELQLRQKTRMPPFARLTRWVFSHSAESTARAHAEQFAQELRTLLDQLQLAESSWSSHAFPCPIERLRKLYRFDVTLQSQRVQDRQCVLDHIRESRLFHKAACRVMTDVDPVVML